MSKKDLFPENPIAVIWDFDKTLSPRYMQEPLFRAYGVDEDAFWREVRALPDYYARAGIKVQEDTCYLTHLLSYVKHGRLPELSNGRLRELGLEIELFPGLPGAFDSLRGVVNQSKYESAKIVVEHYVVSTGLYAMIEGSKISEKVDGIWASVFIEEPAVPGADLTQSPRTSPISQIAGFLDNTTKTRALFEINKGVNKEPQRIKVNDKIDEEDRRVPFRNMIYIADGPSDVPSFSVVRQHGGRAYAVYDESSDRHFKQVKELLEQERVHGYGPANYDDASQTMRWLRDEIEQIADRIVAARSETIKNKVKRGPEHL